MPTTSWTYRCTTHLATPRRMGLLAAIALTFACPADDTVPNDGSGGAGSTMGAASTSAASTVGATSTQGSSSTSSPGVTGGSGDSTAADSTGTEPPPLDACACALPYPAKTGCEAEGLTGWIDGCPEQQPCSRLSVTCPRPGQDLYDCEPQAVFDEAAMQCMLETLRDGTPARLEIDGLMDYGLLGGQELLMVHVLEERTAVRAGCIPAEGVYLENPTAHVLADADYFTACMDVATPRLRYDCMMDGLMGEGTVLPMCPE